MRLAQLAEQLGGELVPAAAGELEVARVASAATAEPDALVFAEDAASLIAALASKAAAMIVPRELVPAGEPGKPLLIVAQSRLAFARAAKLMRAEEPEESGIHATAVIASTAQLGRGVFVEPYVVVGEDVRIGAWTRIGAGTVIGAGAAIGESCRIYPRVVLYPGVELGQRVVVHAGAVLGADGFGYVRDAASGEYVQFPQQGRLVIEDDVEIGANTTIDRGALEETRIERGVKLDNLVHLGHNVRVGQNVVIAAQTGISGSSTVGAGAVVGGQVGMGDHAAIGEGVIVGSRAGILPHKHLRGAGKVFWGTPAKPVREYLRELAALARLARRVDKE